MTSSMKRSNCASGSGYVPSSSIGILRSEHEERRIEFVGAALHRHATLLHGFEQRGLRLGRRAVDFVGQQHVGEHRAGHERETTMPGGRVVLDDVGPGHVRRHQVGRELDAREACRSRARASVEMSSVLARPGHAHQQTVATGEERDQRLLDDGILSDDDLAQFARDALARALQAISECGIIESIECGGGCAGSAAGLGSGNGGQADPRISG